MYTGNTINFDFYSGTNAVYPCVYREHDTALLHSPFNIGLSLCIQGTQHVMPAENFGRQVYPCVYREHFHFINNVNPKVGLSLCIQGTQSAQVKIDKMIRFIPVYTGNTLIITYCFIIKILTVKFLPIFWDIFH